MEMNDNGTQEVPPWICKEAQVSRLPYLPKNMKIFYKDENLHCSFFPNGHKLDEVFLYAFLDVTQLKNILVWLKLSCNLFLSFSTHRLPHLLLSLLPYNPNYLSLEYKRNIDLGWKYNLGMWSNRCQSWNLHCNL